MIQVMEAEIVSMQEAGKTHREIADHRGSIPNSV